MLYTEQQKILPPQAVFAVSEEQNSQTDVTISSISIPSVDINTAVVKGAVKDNQWYISEDSANYISKNIPGNRKGNTIVYGHNTKNIFANLKDVTEGEEITVAYANGDTQTYIVEEIYETFPTDITPIQPTEGDVLTIYTCSGFFDTRRIVVRAAPGL